MTEYPTKEEHYKALVLEHVKEHEMEEWLKRNPPPKKFRGGKYAWAYLEMPTSSFYSFIRKKFLKYPLK